MSVKGRSAGSARTTLFEKPGSSTSPARRDRLGRGRHDAAVGEDRREVADGAERDQAMSPGSRRTFRRTAMSTATVDAT